ncbi:hypothetical protein TWF694_004156 [Orbilia ellipsospora]|uniref:Uncharacterized protein n=1 Tax=Orbilia ellipsospora TaxID=2528407 RepID=A0AAV9WXJ7_9PEZI
MPAVVGISGGPGVALSFANNFWGKDDAGVVPLLERMHCAKTTCEELKSFYSTRASIEDEYARKLLALSRKNLGSQETGSLKASLDIVKLEMESMAKQHQNVAAQMKNELDDALAAFAGAMRERRKIIQGGIEKLLKAKMAQTNAVNKTRDRYEKDCLLIKNYLAQGHMVMGQEERKNKAKLEKTQVQLTTSNGEYENAIKALEETTARWNRDWKAACDKFQDLEEERLDFLKASLWSFANISSTVCVTDDASCEKVRVSLEDCEVEKDIVNFIQVKGTGGEIPDPPKYINFRRGDVSEDGNSNEEPGYSLAQFPREGNPSFRSASPIPPPLSLDQTIEDLENESVAAETVATSARSRRSQSKEAPAKSKRKSDTIETKLKKSKSKPDLSESKEERRRSKEAKEARKKTRSTPDFREEETYNSSGVGDRTPNKLRRERDREQEREHASSRNSRHESPMEAMDAQSQRSGGRRQDPYSGNNSPYGPGRQTTYNEYPLDGITRYCRQQPSDLGSASSPEPRPLSSYGGSEYSNPTSISSGDAYDHGHQMAYGQQAEKSPTKKKGFLSHTPFRRRSKSEKERERRGHGHTQSQHHPEVGQMMPMNQQYPQPGNHWQQQQQPPAPQPQQQYYQQPPPQAQPRPHPSTAPVSHRQTWSPQTAQQQQPPARALPQQPQQPPVRALPQPQQTASRPQPNYSFESTPEPEPIDPRASVMLNIGGNVFDVSTGEVTRAPPRQEEPPPPLEDDDIDLDPIAQALAELKGVHKKVNTNARATADRFYGLQTPAPPATPGIGMRDNRPPPPSFSRSQSDLSYTGPPSGPPPPPKSASPAPAPAPAPAPVAAPVRQEPPKSALGLPPPAFTSAQMQKTTQRYINKTQNLLGGQGGPPQPSQPDPRQRANTLDRPLSRQGQRALPTPNPQMSHNSDQMRAASPAPPARSVSPGPGMVADPMTALVPMGAGVAPPPLPAQSSRQAQFLAAQRGQGQGQQTRPLSTSPLSRQGEAQRQAEMQAQQEAQARARAEAEAARAQAEAQARAQEAQARAQAEAEAKARAEAESRAQQAQARAQAEARAKAAEAQANAEAEARALAEQEAMDNQRRQQQQAEAQRQQELLREQQRKMDEQRQADEHRRQQQQLEMQRQQEQREEQLREQQAREEQLREQQLQEEQLREQQIKEQQLREQQLKEQQLREQQLREQQLQEQRHREQQMKEQQLREQQVREQQLREQQLKEQQLKEQQLREQQMREQQLREQQLKEQQMREQQMREQQLREQQMKEQQLREQQEQLQREREEQAARELQMKQQQEREQQRQRELQEQQRQREMQRQQEEQRQREMQAQQQRQREMQQQQAQMQRPQMPAAQMSRPVSPALQNQMRATSPNPMRAKSPAPPAMQNSPHMSFRGTSPSPVPAGMMNENRPVSQQSSNTFVSANGMDHDLFGGGRPGSRMTMADSRPKSSYGLNAETGAVVLPGGPEQETGVELRDPTRQYSRDGRPVLQYARARYNFDATIPIELSFQKMDILAILRTQDDGWWEAEIVGDLPPGAHPRDFIGLVPSNYLAPL